MIKKFSNFAYGYIIYDDQFWMSDWSYQPGAGYEQAETIYSTVFENDVEDRMEELLKEKKHPKKKNKMDSAE